MSPNTTYTAYLLFDLTESYYFRGFGEEQPLETFVGIEGYGESDNRRVYIPTCDRKYYKPHEPAFIGPQYPVLREDKFFVLELGSYLNKEGGDNRELRMSLREVENKKPKSGIILLGIEIRPSSSMKTS